MSMEYCWNDTHRGELKDWQENLSQCYIMHELVSDEHWLPWQEAGDQALEL
jgi:hypothetical protein